VLWKRAVEVALLCCVAAWPVAIEGDDLVPGERFRARTLSYEYDEGAIFAMPGEKIPLAVSAPARRLHSIDAPQGALTATAPNRWTWEAPVRSGTYQLKVKNPAGETIADFSAFVMVPSNAVKGGVLNQYQIGFYPETPLKGNPVYIPPRGFIEVTKENEDTKVSPNFRIKEFLAKQKGGYPKYLVLDERLVFLLEAIGAHLEPRGFDADDIFIMSGYRTPYYNKQLDDTKYSLHQWGRAADIYLDKDKNGRMDDFNKDKVVSKDDAVALAGVLEGLAKTKELGSFIGGIGIYDSTSAHGPFVHVDTRPWKARW
jgi:Peptidase M15